MRPILSSILTGASLLFIPVSAGFGHSGEQEPMRAPIDPLKYKAACPDYKNYAMRQQYVCPG
jgi:hypothetical protein